jgi:hypothetical protein
LIGAFEFLISRGHSLRELKGYYTIDQVWQFYEEAKENLKAEQLRISMAVRIGFNANKGQWAQYVNDMSKRPKRKRLFKVDFEKLRKIQRRLTKRNG